MKLVRESIEDILKPKDKTETRNEVIKYLDEQIVKRNIIKYDPNKQVKPGKGQAAEINFNITLPEKVDASPEFYYYVSAPESIKINNVSNSELSKIDSILINAYNISSFSLNPFYKPMTAKFTTEDVKIHGEHKLRKDSRFVYIPDYKIILEYYYSSNEYKANVVYFDYGFLKKHLSINESLGDILKPKSREEVMNALKDVTYDDYVDMVDKEIDAQRVVYGDEIVFNKFREFVEEGFNNQTPPSEIANQIITTYYKNEWKPDGGMALSNTGGIEIKIVDSGDGVEYRYTGEIIPKGAEIEFEHIDEEDDPDMYEYTGGVREYFEDENENRYYLDEFMRT